MGRHPYARGFGRLLQIFGLISLLLAMILELSGALGRESAVADLLLAMVFGFSLFYLGRIVEAYARS